MRAEPKLQVQFIQSVAVEKATDDQDQKLDKLTPRRLPGGLPGGAPGGPLARPGFACRHRRGMGGFGGGMAGFGGTQNFPVPLKKGEKEAKALKEFAGTISAMVMAPAEPVITAEKITKAAGETFKGKDGGHIKVTEVKEEDGKITVKFEMETPQNAAAASAASASRSAGGPVPGCAAAAAGPPPPFPRSRWAAGFGFQVERPPAPPAPIQAQRAPASPPAADAARRLLPRPGHHAR